MSTTSPESTDIHAIPLTKRIYTNGSLQYTFVGLWYLFFWILWGDFVFCFFENVFGKLTPLMLDQYHASDVLLANLGSIACIINLFLGPGISQWSDNCRTRWGRRRPFLAVAAPLTAFSVIMMGISPELGKFLYSTLSHFLSPICTETAFILFCFCVFVALFHYFNMVLVNAFNWFFRDVVPQEVVARMQAAMRTIGILSSMVFNAYIFPHIMDYRVAICVSIGIFYAVTFLLMCWKVKEGEYPPIPQEELHSKKSIGQLVENYITYFRECMSVPIYRNFLLIYIINACGGCAGTFAFFFQKNTLGLSLEQIGILGNWVMGVSVVAAIFMGWACDKFNPFRVVFFAQLGTCIANFASFFYVKDYHTLLIASALIGFINTGWAIGMGAMGIFVLPKEKFAQFATATNVIPMGICILANVLTGYIFEVILHHNYQYVYVFGAFGTGLSVIPLILVYFAWHKFGGTHHYDAPHVPHLKPLRELFKSPRQ